MEFTLLKIGILVTLALLTAVISFFSLPQRGGLLATENSEPTGEPPPAWVGILSMIVISAAGTVCIISGLGGDLFMMLTTLAIALFACTGFPGLNSYAKVLLILAAIVVLIILGVVSGDTPWEIYDKFMTP